MSLVNALREKIRDVPDFPKPGIVFKDITPVLMDQPLFLRVIDGMAAAWKDEPVHKIAAIESRGFLFGAPLAHALGVGLVLVRKAGKLPYTTIKQSYALEYGEATLELHTDAVRPGERVLIVDDLLATGGTADAAAKLIERQGGKVVGFHFVIDLAFLKGAERLGPEKVKSLVQY